MSREHEALVRAIADMNPIGVVDTGGCQSVIDAVPACLFCKSEDATIRGGHADDCLWVRARLLAYGVAQPDRFHDFANVDDLGRSMSDVPLSMAQQRAKHEGVRITHAVVSPDLEAEARVRFPDARVEVRTDALAGQWAVRGEKEPT